MRLIYEQSVAGRRAHRLPSRDVPEEAALPPGCLRAEDAALAEVSELDAVRHFTRLSQRNFCVDTNFYPLGSCTMKYNPRILEDVARLDGFAQLHPLLAQLPGGESRTQGALQVLHDAGELLCEITGMAEFTMQPMAGAHGELTGAMIVAAYHRARGNRKTKVLIPDSAHGTNPASAALAGFDVVVAPTDDSGVLDADGVRELVDDETAALMLTCPNTLGLFNPNVRRIADAVHAVDGLVYYDGANLNAILGRVRPGDVGFDLVHLNLHKTFGTPHGGGGPGAGPVGVVERLRRFLPTPAVERRPDGTFALAVDRPDSIGQLAPFYGNFGVVLRAYAYILALGGEGLARVAENAVLNANYLRTRLRAHYDLPFDRTCMHEFVLSASRQAAGGVRALDVAKALLDRGFHAPTVYFPLTVPEALMIEPTECESRETLDAFADAMIEIAETARRDPDSLHRCPTTTPVGRLDEVAAARKPDLCYVPPVPAENGG
ncbi:MAG: aminomethyl-transferring glycine dehydrogenase subunit GcvPB [Candidatus Brocadiaceae bacterium]|nr:aminomethyl-transferring glycine dehydrogenase subunit GcvPB [Candidatus Brocadiaceae bacterium]